MIQQIVKRDGRVVPFELDKITEAIYKAAQALGGQDLSLIHIYNRFSVKYARK